MLGTQSKLRECIEGEAMGHHAGIRSADSRHRVCVLACITARAPFDIVWRGIRFGPCIVIMQKDKRAGLQSQRRGSKLHNQPSGHTATRGSPRAAPRTGRPRRARSARGRRAMRCATRAHTRQVPCPRRTWSTTPSRRRRRASPRGGTADHTPSRRRTSLDRHLWTGTGGSRGVRVPRRNPRSCGRSTRRWRAGRRAGRPSVPWGRRPGASSCRTDP